MKTNIRIILLILLVFCVNILYFSISHSQSVDVKQLIKEGKELYNDKKDYTSALAKFQQVVEIDPQNAEAFYQIGLCYRKLNRYKESLSALEKAQQLDPAISFTTKEKFEEKLKEMRQKAGITSSTTSDNAEQLISEGKALYEQKEYEKALEKFQSAVKIDPNSAKGYYNIGLTYRKLERYEEALTALQKAQQLDPAISFTTKEKFDEKLSEVKEKINKTSQGGGSVADKYINEGKALYDAKDYNSALTKFQQAISADSTSAKAYYNLGLTYRKLERYNEALTALEKAQQLDPAISFTTKEKFEEKLNEVKGKLGISSTTTSTTTRPKFISNDDYLDNAMAQLVGFERGIRDFSTRGYISPQDIYKLDELAKNFYEKDKINLRIIVIDGNRGLPTHDFAYKVYKDLNFGDFTSGADKNIMIMVSPEGTYAKANFMNIGELDVYKIISCAQSARDDFGKSYTDGIIAYANALKNELFIMEKEYNYAKMRDKIIKFGLIGTIIAGIVGLFVFVSISLKRKKERFKQYLDTAYTRLTLYADRLSDAQLGAQIINDQTITDLIVKVEKDYFKADTILEKIRNSKEDKDITKIQPAVVLLDSIEADLDQVEQYIKSALAGKPIPKPSEASTEKLACYFCSRPIPNSTQGRVIKLVDSKGEKNVLACHFCFSSYQRGELPRVKTVNYQGKQVHWSQVPDYDPYYDYYHPARYGRTYVDVWIINDSYFTGYTPLYSYYSSDIGSTPVQTIDLDDVRTEHNIQQAAGSSFGDSHYGESAPGIDFGSRDQS